MNWLNKLERKFGRFAIHNLILYMIGGYVIGFGIYYFVPSMLPWLTLEPMLILRGQVWRIVSWVLVPPSGSIFTILIMCMLYYSLGTALERTWGAFRFNIYIFSGILFTVIGAFILYFASGGQLYGLGSLFSTYYINMSIFLAFATSYPDMQLLLYFIIPIKIKWLALVYALLILNTLMTGNIVVRVAIIASLLNFFLFFLATRKQKRTAFVYRAKEVKRTVKRPEPTHIRYPEGSKHKCAVCGRTELDDPSLEFRYCSKCSGNREYCQEHLFTHNHVN